VSSNANAQRGFVEIGKTCNIPEPNLDGVKKWLAATKHTWLLVLDNADDRDVDYADYFPSGNRGCIILTTRNPQCRTHNNVGYRDLQALDPKEAVILLLGAAEIEPDLWESHTTATAMVVNVLGSHALAIVQAGAFIRQGLCSLEEYPNHFIQQRQRLLQFRPLQANSVYGDVHATFEVSAKLLKDSAQHSAKIALRLLGLLAFFHFDGITISDIAEKAWKNARGIASGDPAANSAGSLALNMWHVSRLCSLMHTRQHEEQGCASCLHLLSTPLNKIRPQTWREDSMASFNDEIDIILPNEECAHLASFSIVQVHNTTRKLTMYPLAHAWASDCLEAPEREECRVAASRIFALSFKIDKPGPFESQIQPHDESYMQAWLLKPSLIFFEVVQFLHPLAVLLIEFRSLSKAERILLLCIEHESVKIEPDADIAVSDASAGCYRLLGKLSEAKTLLEEKLQIYESRSGPAHQGLLYLQNHLGRIYVDLGRSEVRMLILQTVTQTQRSMHGGKKHGSSKYRVRTSWSLHRCRRICERDTAAITSGPNWESYVTNG